MIKPIWKAKRLGYYIIYNEDGYQIAEIETLAGDTGYRLYVHGDPQGNFETLEQAQAQYVKMITPVPSVFDRLRRWF